MPRPLRYDTVSYHMTRVGRSTDPHPPRRRPGRPPEIGLDEQILEATLALLAEVGYEGLRVEQVARRARTAKTSVYRRWPDRDALTVAAVRYYLEGSGDGVRRRTRAGTGTLRGDLLAHAEELVRMLTRERIGVLAGLLLAIRTRPDLAEMVRASLVQHEVSAMSRILEEAVARDELDASPRSPLVAHILPAVLFTRLFVLDQPPDQRFLCELVDELLLPLLRPRLRGHAHGRKLRSGMRDSDAG